MDFDFSPDQLAFRDQVEKFLDEHDDPVVFDVTRENMAQVADIPERRALMGKVAEQGWLGITWPKEWGGQEGDGVYEYLGLPPHAHGDFGRLNTAPPYDSMDPKVRAQLVEYFRPRNERLYELVGMDFGWDR